VLICASAIRSFRLRVENLRYQTVPIEIVLEPRFNRPPASANGGLHVRGGGEPTRRAYRRGDSALAASARRPLRWVGGRLWDGDVLVAEGRAAPLELDVPEPPHLVGTR
jgi:hypothetical protein